MQKKGFEMSISMIIGIILVIIVVAIILWGVIAKGGSIGRGILDMLSGLFG